MTQAIHSLQKQDHIQYQDASTNTGDHEPQAGDKVLILRNQVKSDLEQQALEPVRPQPITPPVTPTPTNNQTAVKMLKAGLGATVLGGSLALAGYGVSVGDSDSSVASGLFGVGFPMMIGGVASMVRGAYRFVTGAPTPEPIVTALEELQKKV